MELASKTRSRVTNGGTLFALEGVDRRGAYYRRFRDLLLAHLADLGGADRLSEFERQLCRRCAFLEIESERLEGEAVQGKAVDLEAYVAMVNAHGRAASRVGLRRKARDVTPPNLQDHVEATYGAAS